MSEVQYSQPVKNRSGYYEIRWTEWDERAGRGRSRSQSCHTKIKREAERFRRNFIAAEGAVRADAGCTVADVIDAYLSKHAGRNNASKTQEWSLKPVRAWFAGHDVAELDEDELDAYTDARLETVKTGTVRKELSALRAALNWAASPKRTVKLLSADAIPHIALPAEGAPRRNFLDAGEAARMFELARERAMGPDPFRSRRVGLFICLALETAARAGAIRGLTWDRVDLDRGQIEYRDPDMAVTNKRRVPVPVSRKLLPVLRDAYARREQVGTDCDVGHVLGHDGSVYKGFVAFREEHGFNCTIHDLRRTWATLRVMWGARLEEVAAVLGDTVEITEKHYAHFQPGYGRSAVDLDGPMVGASLSMAAE